MQVRKKHRRGAQLVEAAIVFPVLMSILLGMILGSVGILTNAEIAMLAREGARWAAVHGPTYASEQGQPIANSSTVLSQGILPMAAGVSPSGLNCVASFNSAQTIVTVTVTYNWTPMMIFPGVNLGSTSVMAVTY